MSTAKTPSAAKMLATRDFTDAGTGRSFLANKPVDDVEPGEMANYAAAGLVKADEQPAAKPAA